MSDNNSGDVAGVTVRLSALVAGVIVFARARVRTSREECLSGNV